MRIEIKALDTLFFKDGKPFTMGENHWTDSIFPPNLSTIYGAIRTAYFIGNMELFQKLQNNKELNTEKDPTKKLKITKLFYKINDGRNDGNYYNMPLDLVELKDISELLAKRERENKKYKVYPLRIKENKYANSNPLKYLLYFDEHVKAISDGIIHENEIEDYINGNLEDIEICKMSDYLCDEPKVGIGLDKSTRTSKDSRLYRVDFKRLKEMSLIVEFEGIELNKKGVIRLGGEGKYAVYEDDSSIIEPYEFEIDSITNNRFKVTLMTQAIFENGWLPKDIDEEKFILENDKFKIKLVAASVGKYSLIGGYDMAKNEPKPMLKAVPAGSTYFFEILKGETKDIIRYFHLKSVSDKMQEEGYGISFVSKWGDQNV